MFFGSSRMASNIVGHGFKKMDRIINEISNLSIHIILQNPGSDNNPTVQECDATDASFMFNSSAPLTTWLKKY